MLRRAIYWSVQFIALVALWFLFVHQLNRNEAVVGVGAAVLSAIAAEAVRGEERLLFLPGIHWLLEARRLPGKILKDNWLVTRKLARMVFLGDRTTGSFRTVAFDAGGDDARAVGHRALAILYSTLPPNSIVIGIDRKRHEMVLHVLEGRA